MNQNNKSYKIEILITAAHPIQLKKPCYWILWGSCGQDWLNECCGWAQTPELAWSEAYDFYQSYKAIPASLHDV